VASVSNINTGGSYNIIQTVFKLSMMSNLANGITGETASAIEAQLASDITQDMQGSTAQIGSWSTVWGPVVFQNLQTLNADAKSSTKTGVSDNAMYVAYNQTADVYVVAVAATNMNSTYDLYDLDLNVSSTVSFPTGINPQYSTNPASQNVGNVSAGAALGITNLLNMQDPTTSQSLQTFLNGVVGSGATLIFTGHSLGGSLSPTLAAWLYPSAPAGWSAIYVVPTAGPSTGDQGFCNNFTNVFPPYTVDGVDSPYGVVNQIIWNAYDCVPHAWTNVMNAQPDSPQNDIVWGPVTQNGTVTSCQSIYGTLNNTAWGQTAQSVYGEIDSIYELAPGQPPYVKLSNSMFTPASQPGGIHTKKQFELTAYQQHVPEYATFLGVSLTSGQSQTGVAILAEPPKSKG
jgi:hypothetical protein